MTLAWFDLSCHVAISPHVLFTCFLFLGFVDVFGFSIEAGVSFHAGCFVRFVASMMLRTDTNGASGRLLTFLAVSLCVFKCSNIYCRFHGSSGAHALASLKTQQKCQVEQGQKNRVRCIYGYFVRFVANMMLRTVLRADCSRFWLFLCVCVFKCSNIHCHFHGSSGAHALASLKTQQKCQVEQGQMYICI